MTSFNLLSHFTAADQINDKVEKSLQNSSSQKEKSISFKTKPLSPVKSNELGLFLLNDGALIAHFIALLHHPLDYSVKRDFISETKDSKIDDTRRMTPTAPPKKAVDGVGPTTKEGMPISMRSVSSLHSHPQHSSLNNRVYRRISGSHKHEPRRVVQKDVQHNS